MDPSPPLHPAEEKAALRKAFRAARNAHVARLPERLRALMLNRPPAPVAALIPEGTVVGLYHAGGAEAPSVGWARWFAENGRQVALPWFSGRDAAMEFRLWNNPWDDEELVEGPWRAFQPTDDSASVTPEAVVVPVLAFTAAGQRLGQGGGHYDRWLAENPLVPAIGLAWDCQLAETLPYERHDRPLTAVITPTRIYEGQK